MQWISSVIILLASSSSSVYGLSCQTCHFGDELNQLRGYENDPAPSDTCELNGDYGNMTECAEDAGIVGHCFKQSVVLHQAFNDPSVRRMCASNLEEESIEKYLARRFPEVAKPQLDKDGCFTAPEADNMIVTVCFCDKEGCNGGTFLQGGSALILLAFALITIWSFQS